MQGQGGCRDYWEFRGVRYAAAPVGELRFKAPRPAAPWKGVVNATAEGSGCPQVSQGKVTGSEDCLNLDVYTPTLKCSGRSYPVIVWFHGGNLITGGVSRKEYGPDFLVHHDVVLVEPNYRLGALGFLNLDTSSVPGNAGIKDGLAALRWVRDNVAAFCGDPARVTLMGQSAGAKLVGFMALSKGGQGLFRAAIQMSGTANSPLAYTEDHVQRAHDLAARLGNTGTDAASVERTLLRADWRDLTRRTFEMNDNSGWGLPYNPFVASPERRPADGEEVALNRDPESLLSDPAVPRVPTLAGVVSGEGVAFTYGNVEAFQTSHSQHVYQTLKKVCLSRQFVPKTKNVEDLDEVYTQKNDILDQGWTDLKNTSLELSKVVNLDSSYSLTSFRNRVLIQVYKPWKVQG
ncbi:hypothetical protein ONE63_002713 [Megalurothrips usitatus]|uniref:Carboxylesterase type B domain-containing protein n=1 Tax=Megalurothrips usitatus TaxID=439358 RepID=A0AAV7XDJ5_9NEOP|nr:hypothetical protein ONE63_002713 [Megalurothrips usitatus]